MNKENLPEVQFINPATGRYSKQWSDPEHPLVGKVSCKQEQAIVLWTLGQFAKLEDAAKASGLSKSRFGIVLNSPPGQAIVARVKGELDFKYQSLYRKFIDTVECGLDSPNIQVALAAASLFAKTQIGSKSTVEYKITAEDVVQQLMNGTYKGPEDVKK